MKKGRRFGDIVSNVYLILLSIVAVFPLLWLLVSAFKSSSEMLNNPTKIWPIQWTLANFKTVLFTLKFTVNIRNSLIIAGSTTVVAIIISSLAAYGVVRFFPKLGNVMTKILVTTYMFPSIMLVIPYAMVMAKLNLTKTLRNYHMALHKCLQQAVKERLLIYNPCDAVTLPSGEKPEISVFTNDQQRALVQASYRYRYGVFIRLDLCTGLRMGELLALKWEDIDFSTAQLHVRRTINRLAKYEAHDGENKTEIVFGTPKTKNSRRTIPLTRTMADELARWKQQQAQDKIRAGDKYTDDGFIVTNEFGHYFEQKTFKDYYDRLLKDADIGHFTFHALRHTFATRALERGMDYKTLSAILGHYSVAFTMDTYVHSMDEHKRHEMDKMDDMFGMQYSISVENQPYPVLCTLSPDGCTAHVPDFPKIVITASTLDAALLEVKQQVEKALRQYKNPPIPTKQEQIVVPNNSVLVLVKAS